MKSDAMVINRETAMSFWNKSFGKASKVKDFAGREMVKAAYNDRNSDYGWNIDHILPQSKGGKTTESNLICCHILTNDEKADKFPCFSANGKQFEIVKVENHYEIKEINKKSNNDEVASVDSDINFYDSAAGIRFYKTLKGIQNKSIFVGIVVIELEGITDTAIIDFINEIFSDKNLYYSKENNSTNGFILGNGNNKTTITIADYNLSQKEDISDFLDRCILLNTYMGYYFTPKNIVKSYRIFYGVHTERNKMDALSANNFFKLNYYYYNNFSYGFYGGVNDKYSLVINELVKINTKAEQKIADSEYVGKDKLGYNVYKYEYIYTKLAENLKKLTN